jgi:uncharacterized membrane protein YphA (DoxX/SURF4 family)
MEAVMAVDDRRARQGARGVKAKKIGYWVSTVIVALLMLSGGVAQVTLQNAEGFTKLGYPIYFMVLLGVWKLLGGVALLVPRFPRVKEWAYAGIFFDLSGAAVTNAAVGGSAGHIVAPLVCIAILFASWALRPENRTLGTLLPARA